MEKQKQLKSYKGFEIWKAYETNPDGTINKDTIYYDAYINENIWDSSKSLLDLKRKIDRYRN